MRRPESPTGLAELAAVFLRIGATSFGGPAAHTAMMEAEIVQRRQWLRSQEFLDLLGAVNLIPGPNSTELAIHIGYRRAGWPGLVVAGVCFVVPAMLIVLGMAWAYVRFGGVPQVQGLLYGVKPVIIAVVVQALWGLARTAIKTRALAMAGVTAVMLNALGLHELLVLLGVGLAMMLGSGLGNRPGTGLPMLLPLFGGAAAPATGIGVAAAANAVPVGLGAIFLFFAKVGSVLFGSGYVLLAFLRADLVERWGWLSESQLMDAVAVGQVTPGPLFTTATFIGYLLAGSSGALVATAGMLLPAFVFVALSIRLVPWMRSSRAMGSFLDGINVASLALMAVVTWRLGMGALVDWPSAIVALAAGGLLVRYRVNTGWLVLGGAVFGLVGRGLR